MEHLPEQSPLRDYPATYRPSTEGVVRFIDTHYQGFDLANVLHRLDALSKERMFEWTSVVAEVAPSGNLIISHEYDDLDADDRPLLLKVILKLPVDGCRVVTHEEMFLPIRFQRRGLSAELLKPYYEQYRNARVDSIRILASDTGGGYVWAKYGFRAIYKKELNDILERPETLTITSRVISNLRLTITDFYNTRPDTVAFPIRAWTPFTFSKELLMGTTWHGVLDLNDAEHRAFFEDYLYSRPQPLPS